MKRTLINKHGLSPKVSKIYKNVDEILIQKMLPQNICKQASGVFLRDDLIVIKDVYGKRQTISATYINFFFQCFSVLCYCVCLTH